MIPLTRILRVLIFLTAPLAVLSLPSIPLRAADAATKPPELKVLDKLAGEWITETTVEVLDGRPQSLKSTGTAARVWGLNGRFLEESAQNSAGERIKVIFGYDDLKKAYRWWYFNSTGITVDMTGQWNDATQSFSFQTDLGNGLTQTASIHVIDNDNHEWSSRVVDGSGKVLFQGGGKLKRKN